MTQVTVLIDKKGKATISVDGVVGSGCTKIVEDLTKSLQAKVLDDQKTAEFYCTEEDTVVVGA